MTKRINDYLYGITGKKVDERTTVLRQQVLAGVETGQRPDLWWVPDDEGVIGDIPNLSFKSDVVKEEPIPVVPLEVHSSPLSERLPRLPRISESSSEVMKQEPELIVPPLEQISPKRKRTMERI